ncbi:MAG: helix-turn-helix domain-containing protein [Polyangia bacterium]
MSTMKIDGRHIGAARELLEITQEELAAWAGVSRESIVNVENNKTTIRATTLEKIKWALEKRGIEFSNGDSPGVKLRPEKAINPG